MVTVHELTARELWERKDVYQNVDKVLDMLRTNGTGAFSTTQTVTVHEANGIIQTNDGFERKHVIYAGIEGKKDIILYEAEENEDTFIKFDWEEMAGRTLSRGVFEQGFHHQMMMNDMVIKKKQILDVAAKLGIVTDDETFEQNMSELVNGFIWNLQGGKSVQPFAFNTSMLPQLDQTLNQVEDQLKVVTSTYEAVTGETLPSGTPFRSVAIQNQEGSSLFAYRRENLAERWQEPVEKWFMPHVRKKVTRDHLLSGTYGTQHLKMLDEAFARREVRREMLEDLKSGKGVKIQAEYNDLYRLKMDMQRRNADRRFLDIKKGDLDYKDGQVKIVTSNEGQNKAVAMERIQGVLGQITAAPEMLRLQPVRHLIAKLIDLTGTGIKSFELDFDAMSGGGAEIPNLPTPKANTDVKNNETAVISQ
jgi:hypothetical protein